MLQDEFDAVKGSNRHFDRCWRANAAQHLHGFSHKRHTGFADHELGRRGEQACIQRR
jgi:hypothetical protein